MHTAVAVAYSMHFLSWINNTVYFAVTCKYLYPEFCLKIANENLHEIEYKLEAVVVIEQMFVITTQQNSYFSKKSNKLLL